MIIMFIFYRRFISKKNSNEIAKNKKFNCFMNVLYV